MARKSTGADVKTDQESDDRATSEVIVPVGPEKRPTLATELLRAEAGDVEADVLTMERAGAEHISANRVVMTNSGARTVDARSAQVDRSGILAVNSDKAVFANSSVIAAVAEQSRFVRSRVLLMKTDEATLDGETKVAVYLGPAADNVRPLFDVRGAAAFGAGVGAVLVLLGTVLRRMIRIR